MQIVHHLQDGVWRDFLAHHPQGNIFHTPEMYEVFSKTPGYHPVVWAVLDSGGQILAFMLSVEITLNRLFEAYTSRAVVFGGVLLDPQLKGHHALDLLIKAYLDENGKHLLFTEIRNVNDLGDAQIILVNNGFNYEDHMNFLIDLNRPVERIFNSIGKRTRKNIRRGLNKGSVKIKEATTPEEIQSSILLIQSTYRNIGIPLAHQSLFIEAFRILHPKKMIRFTLAEVMNEPAATSVDLIYKDVIYGWYGGVDRKYSAYIPNELLTWEILRWGANNGFDLYDFGGAGKPSDNYGVRDFKAKFGGELVCFGRNTRIHSKFRFATSKLGYEIFRRLWY